MYVCFFCNKNVIMLMNADCGKIVNWVNITYKHLVKELNRWSKAHAKILEGKAKENPKKDICNSFFVIDVLM